jgi:hypothetical protein
MSSRSVRNLALALGLFALVVYVGYIVWIGVAF